MKEQIKKLQNTRGYENLCKILGEDLGQQIYDLVSIAENYDQSKWIKAEDEKPPRETNLSGNPEDFSITVICFGDGISTCGYWNYDMNCWLYEGESMQNCTHWMYLPEDPVSS